MTIVLDRRRQSATLPEAPTLGDALDWAREQLAQTGRIIVSVKLGGQTLDGPVLTEHHGSAIGDRDVELATEDRAELARRMLGKLAALIEWLAPKHHEIAALLEKQQPTQALEQLGSALTAWQQIQQAFGSVCTMLSLPLDRLMVNDQTAEDLIGGFAGQLQEIGSALKNQDMVLLSDVMQYEMDGAVSNWMNLLATVLGVVDGAVSVE